MLNLNSLRTGLLASVLCASPVFATLEAESMFTVEKLENRAGRHIVTLSDFSVPAATDGRAHIIDADKGDYLGFLSTGYWYSGINLPRARNILVSPETYFSRGTRGERVDVVTIYNGDTLEVEGEIGIPPKRFTAVKMQGTSLITDDDRFLVVLNHTPATSLSLVDLDTRSFVTEIDIPGCFNIYPTGKRSFFSICGDGAFLKITLDEQGQPLSLERSSALFDPMADPITVSGVRDGEHWHFVSRDGVFHSFLTTNNDISAREPWSLFTEEEREEDWRISGFQHLAVHGASQLAYVLVHQGPPETFEDPGTEVWIYDIASGQRVDEIEMERMALSIEVSQDNQPQLYSIAADFNMPTLFQAYIYLVHGAAELEKNLSMVLDVYDARGGEFLRSIEEIGNFPSYIQVWPATTEAEQND
jgi:methylamine dehydrogenase heavy chain